MSFVLVGVGAAVGASLRFLMAHWRGPHIGTLLVNLAGSLLLGALSAAALSGSTMALWGAGFCGGLTTFSAYAVHTHALGRTKGLLYTVGTIGGSVLCCWLGFVLAS